MIVILSLTNITIGQETWAYTVGKWHHCQFKIFAVNSQNIWDEINRAQGFFSALRLSVAASPAIHTRSFAANHQELGKKKGTSGIQAIDELKSAKFAVHAYP